MVFLLSLLHRPILHVFVRPVEHLRQSVQHGLAGRVAVTLERQQVREIAELKMPDLNASSVESAMRMIEGTARSMGIVVES